jgi:hypothetical protein
MSLNKIDKAPPFYIMILESYKPKTLVVYSQNFQYLVQPYMTMSEIDLIYILYSNLINARIKLFFYL